MILGHPAWRPSATDSGSWHLLVDLSLLRPGGENGGIKQLIFGYLAWLAAREGSQLTITFLTWSCSHAEVRSLARAWDNLICVRVYADEDLSQLTDWRNREWVELSASPQLALDLGVDLIYSPQNSAEFLCPGIPSIVTIVDLLHRDYPMTLRPADVTHRETIFAQLARTADSFQCISTFTMRRLQAHYQISADRVFRNYIAVHDRLSVPPAIVDHPNESVRPYFFYPANAWPHKNHLTLLVAFGLYFHGAGASAWDLVLTGHDDEQMRQILATASALGLREKVRYVGHVDDHRFSEIWHNAGALVFPSLHEGFGIPLVEAMHMGIPVLCSADTSLPEVAGEGAMLIDARNPEALALGMSRISGDPQLRRDLVERGRQQLSRFSIEAEGQVFLNRCRSLLAAPRLLWSRGVYPDGWTESIAWFALPSSSSRAELVLEIAAMPAARQLRVYIGRNPFGGFTLPANTTQRFTFSVYPEGKTLALHAVDAANLNPADHRRHGVLLNSAVITLIDGQQFDLRKGVS